MAEADFLDSTRFGGGGDGVPGDDASVAQFSASLNELPPCALLDN